MLVLRHLSQRLILSGFRLSVRKWQKIPGGEFLRLGQIWNPERFYSCSRQICHQHKAKASLRNLFHLTYTTSSVILFLYQLFVSIRKGFITRSLGLKRSQEFSYAQQAAGTSGFFYFAGNCIYFENEHKRHSLFLCLNAGKGGLRKQMIPELARHKRKETLCQSKELRIL